MLMQYSGIPYSLPQTDIFEQRDTLQGEPCWLLRTCWIFQCYILFLGCKNMHLIGMYTWGFCKSCVLKHSRYVLNIDWFFFNCLFSVISSNSSKYAATTSVSYKYVLLKEGDVQCLHSEIFKIFGNLNNILSCLYPLNMSFQNLKP